MAKAKAKKKDMVAKLLAAGTFTNVDIAKKVNCHPYYVSSIRRGMAKADANVLELTKEMEVPAVAADTQEGGTHYLDLGIQPWDVFDTWPTEQRIGAYRGNCLKYIMRLESKDTRALNARKLAQYARKLVEVLEEGEGVSC